MKFCKYIKANKKFNGILTNSKFVNKKTNQEIIKCLQEKIDNNGILINSKFVNNDPNIDAEKAKETIEYIKNLKYDD